LSFAEPSVAGLTGNKVRLAFGAIAACAAPAFILAFLLPAIRPLDLSPSPDLWLGISLVLSPFVIFFFLPVIIWQLPYSQRPLLACLAVGAASIAAPMALLALIVGAATGEGEIGFLVLLATATVLPVGLASGLAFWLCVVWRNPRLSGAS
jgi:hypothetical protein